LWDPGGGRLFDFEAGSRSHGVPVFCELEIDIAHISRTEKSCNSKTILSPDLSTLFSARFSPCFLMIQNRVECNFTSKMAI
jgi:hypothetical protein